MNKIAGIPYFEIKFDKNGGIVSAPTIPAGFTDLIVFSHGWRNDEIDARDLYTKFFTSFKSVADRRPLDPGKKIAALGVFWPSKPLNDRIAIGGKVGGNAAGVGGADSGGEDVLKKIQDLKSFLGQDAPEKFDELEILLPRLETSRPARDRFTEIIRSLLDPVAKNDEDASIAFFEDDGEDIIENLIVRKSVKAGGEEDDSLTAGITERHNAENDLEAAGFSISGMLNGTMNLLNYASYYEMKSRAGTVGTKGLAKYLDSIADSVSAIHLVGHSFGGRLVTATALAASTKKLKSMTLLQAAFSHYGFSASGEGFFRTVVTKGKIHGPILITHSDKDKAVGTAYPLASRLSNDQTMSLGDANDRFGGMGRNGAQKTPETVEQMLLESGDGYDFKSGKIYNLNGDLIIADHGDVHRVPCAGIVVEVVR